MEDWFTLHKEKRKDKLSIILNIHASLAHQILLAMHRKQQGSSKKEESATLAAIGEAKFLSLSFQVKAVASINGFHFFSTCAHKYQAKLLPLSTYVYATVASSPYAVVRCRFALPSASTASISTPAPCTNTEGARCPRLCESLPLPCHCVASLDTMWSTEMNRQQGLQFCTNFQLCFTGITFRHSLRVSSSLICRANQALTAVTLGVSI